MQNLQTFEMRAKCRFVQKPSHRSIELVLVCLFLRLGKEEAYLKENWVYSDISFQHFVQLLLVPRAEFGRHLGAQVTWVQWT